MANPIDISRKIYQVLVKLYGETFVKNLIGRQTNIKKLTKLDPNAPTENTYSKSALKNERALETADAKIQEYAGTIFAEKNRMKQMNFLENAENVLASRNAQTGTTESMVKSVAESMFGPLGKSGKPTPKPEAEIFDIKTQETVKPEGIQTLKSEIGLPEGVEPGSIADKAIKESAEYKMNQQGVTSLLDPKYKAPKTTTLDEDEIADIGARGYSAAVEGKRRAVIRQVLLKDARIDLPKDVRKSLENYDDLKGGGDQSMDPLKIFEDYYERDNEVLGALDGVIDTAKNEFEAADTFLSFPNEDKLKLKKPMVRESLDDEAVEMEETKDLGERLKEADDDPDMPEMAEGGRIGFKFGTGKEGIKTLLNMVNKKFGKNTMKTTNKIDQPDFLKLKKEFEAFNKRNKKLTDEDIKDYELDLGDAETWYEEGMTVADAEKLVADRKAYEAKMLTDYKAGRLDPQTGEKGREGFLRKKMEEMEMSGDKRLMSEDEIMELVDIENRRKLNASGGLNYLMGL